MFFYNIFATVAAIVTAPILLWLGVVRGHRVRERIGIYNGRVSKFLKGKRPIWFHAASVGEVRVLAAFIPAYLRTSHEKKIIVSVVTRTGKETAQKILPKECLVVFLPLDLEIFVRRAFKVINPKALIIAETEFWPNLIKYAARKNVRTYFINGRLSNRSYKGYKLIKPFLRDVMSGVEYFFMQSSSDARRLVKLGIDEKKVIVSGNIKFDLNRTDDKLRKFFKNAKVPNWAQGRRILVAGSTHRGEEKIVLEAFTRLREKYTDALLVLAPRHLNRLDEVVMEVQNSHMEFVKKSEMDSANGNYRASSENVIILDTMGELQYVYNWGEAAFVGGSLNNTGGHNPLEPAACSIPVAFGPNMLNCKEIAEALVEAGGAKVIKNSDDLYVFFDSSLSDPDMARRMGQASNEISQNNNGIAVNVAEKLFNLVSNKKNSSQLTSIGN